MPFLPLTGMKIVDVTTSIAGPYCAEILAALGAEVVKVERPDTGDDGRAWGPPFWNGESAMFLSVNAGKRSLAVSLADERGREIVMRLAAGADVFLQSLRPGLAGRIGLGADLVRACNSRLVYCSIGAYGTRGPLSHEPGYDALMQAAGGLISMTGEPGRSGVRVGSSLIDMGTGIWAALGIVAALLEASRSGQGQVVDAAITDGAASLMSVIYGLRASGIWSDERDANLLDGGAHFYDVYRTKDGKFVSIGSIEPQFYALLLEKTGLKDNPKFAAHMAKPEWPELSAKMAEVIATKTRDEWTALMEGTDVCFAPVLSMAEAPAHPHNAARGTFVDVAGLTQPAPAPRFSRTPSAIQGPPGGMGATAEDILAEWGVSARPL